MARPPETVPWRLVGAGLALRVHLTPRSKQDAVDGLGATVNGPVVKAHVRAVPADGRANTALESLIADWLGVGRRAVEVTGGQTSRHKTVTITGQPEKLEQIITTRLAATKPRLSDACTDH